MSAIDRSYLAGIFSDPNELEAIVAEAIVDLRSGLRDIASKLEAHDANAVREIAHRMKGVAGQLGARSVQSAASELEEAAKSDSASGSAELQTYAALLSALTAAVAAL
jgi:HPt (histidine-containing phosphotransfer) domain-containing protein